jgi:hypothetical protein
VIKALLPPDLSILSDTGGSMLDKEDRTLTGRQVTLVLSAVADGEQSR